MPFVRISVLGRPLEPVEIHRLQIDTSRLMTSVMRKPLEGTAVLVEELQGAWTIAGHKVVRAAHVDVTIGRGTNSAEEKARFLNEMMCLLREVLGPELPEQSYIVVHELDPTAYGRGGLTRAERERRASLAQA